MTIDIQPHLASVAALFRPLGPNSFSVDGKEVLVAPTFSGGAGPQRNPTYDALKNALYQSYYIRFTQANAHTPQDYAVLPFEGLAKALDAANSGEPTWDRGWVLMEVDRNGKAEILKGDVHRTVQANNLRLQSDPNGPFKPGNMVMVFCPGGSGESQQHFYFAFSKVPFPEGQGRLLRLYWNVNPAGAVKFVAAATALLNRHRVPFQLKAVQDPSHYQRPDSAVLYFQKSNAHWVAAIAQEVHAGLGDDLREGVPPFSYPVAKGLGFAENPYSGDSFGMERCGVLAAGLLRAWNKGISEGTECVAMLNESLLQSGYLLDRPYLNPGSHVDYPFESFFHD